MCLRECTIAAAIERIAVENCKNDRLYPHRHRKTHIATFARSFATEASWSCEFAAHRRVRVCLFFFFLYKRGRRFTANLLPSFFGNFCIAFRGSRRRQNRFRGNYNVYLIPSARMEETRVSAHYVSETKANCWNFAIVVFRHSLVISVSSGLFLLPLVRFSIYSLLENARSHDCEFVSARYTVRYDGPSADVLTAVCDLTVGSRGEVVSKSTWINSRFCRQKA